MTWQHGRSVDRSVCVRLPFFRVKKKKYITAQKRFCVRWRRGGVHTYLAKECFCYLRWQVSGDFNFTMRVWRAASHNQLHWPVWVEHFALSLHAQRRKGGEGTLRYGGIGQDDKTGSQETGRFTAARIAPCGPLRPRRRPRRSPALAPGHVSSRRPCPRHACCTPHGCRGRSPRWASLAAASRAL